MCVGGGLIFHHVRMHEQRQLFPQILTVYSPFPRSKIIIQHKLLFFILVGNPIGKKTLIFTFDGKIEYIILPMLILFLDMWQNTYGWMPSV